VLDAAYTTLLDARGALQRLTSRPANVLTLEHQAGAPHPRLRRAPMS
jgi:hypothetical protein